MPFGRGQVQVDEIRVKRQGRAVVGLALALAVPSRLWLRAAVRPTRDRTLVQALVEKVRGCLAQGALLLTSDGFNAYQGAFSRTFRSPEKRTGRRGRPRLVPWPELVVVQVVVLV